MKKTKKTQKVWRILAVIATFLLTFTVVYASVNYFYNKYGTREGGYLNDGILSPDDWDALMTDLDNYSCPEQDCPECPSCSDWVRAYLSPSGKVLRKFRSGWEPSDDQYDRFLYDYDGEKTKWSVSNYAWMCQWWWTTEFNMFNVQGNSNGWTFCAYVSNCEELDTTSYYYVHWRWTWIKIKFQGSCNASQITFKTYGTVGSLGSYRVSVGDGSDIFEGDKYLVINP